MDLELSVVTLPPDSARSAADGYVVVALRGECDVTNSHILRERLLALLDGQAPRVILDLTALAFIDASGATALVIAGRRARQSGVTLALAAAQKIVARVLSLTTLDQHFPVYATVAEALADGPDA
jgi:anti-sigma B factor antagonist